VNAASSITGFRLRVLFGMMLVVGAFTALALWIAQQQVTQDARQQLEKVFQNEVASLDRARAVRHAALVERSRSLARKPRIHAALEDDALDLLYPNAEDELRDVMEGDADADHPLRANFYRFLDAEGKVIPAPASVDAGKLSSDEEAKLSLSRLPATQQIGYLARSGVVDEIIAAPIISTETNEVIASIVLGFEPFQMSLTTVGMKAGIWADGQLFIQGADEETVSKLSALMTRTPERAHAEIVIGGIPHLVFSQLLNPGSMFPHTFEVCVYSLADSVARQRQLRWQILSVGALMLLGAAGMSHWMAGRLSVPVERLAVDSARNVVRREQAEAALEQTSVELERSMRFSADTSHQLKTPITVLRAGLEELRLRPGMSAAAQEEIGTLIYQTAKLSSMIHDLLLLSRLDAGRLELDLVTVDLTQLIDSLADDLSAVPSAPDFDVEVNVPTDLRVLGEKRYISMILQNLIENAWKYNHAGGTIAITAHEEGPMLVMRVGNTGPGIPAEAQAHVFERFHRASMGENVPGHGLGLNIARELALLHGGDLRLIRSDSQWTEFEVTFQRADVTSSP
jgi:signal transduction histidine kinase